MAEEHYEREDKYRVTADWVLPDLAAALPSGARIEPGTVRLSSRYFDTADGALLGHGVTLRSRTGDSDTGWQLKLPAGAGRTEIRLPAGAGHDQVPDELQELVRGLAAGQPLRPVATLDTVRSLSRILDGGGTLLAELADDQVSAAVPGPTAAAVRWREVEVELGAAGDEKLLAAIGGLLTKAGARPAAGPPKLAYALGAVPGRVEPARFKKRLGGLLWDYLDEQAAMLATGDVTLRRGTLPASDPDDDAFSDTVHDTRVASRRYRSALRIFHDLFDPARAAALDAELAWYAALLGEVRDRQVLRELLVAAVRDLSPELVHGPVAELISDHLRAEQAAALDRLTVAMSGSRYLAMMAELTRWHREPPFTAVAGKPAGNAGKYLRSAQSTLHRRLRRADRAPADDHRLHQARKAAKRARYAAELAVPVLGKRARKQVRQAKKLQEVLGRHQDEVLAAAVLLELATAAETGPGAFTLGVLYGRMTSARSASLIRT